MFHVPEKYREPMKGTFYENDKSFGNNGMFKVKSKSTKQLLHIMASDGGSWDHVSVSLKHRCPTWAEMQQVKELFWDDDDVVVQYHPAKKDYVNCHPNTLHMWKPQYCSVPTPPSIFVGPKESFTGE